MSLRTVSLLLVLTLAVGCAPCAAPELRAPAAVNVPRDGAAEVALRELVSGDASDVEFTALAGEGLVVRVDGDVLTVVAETGFEGATTVTVTATTPCGKGGSQSAEVVLDVIVGDDAMVTTCPVTVRYPDRAGADAAFLAGTFNDWGNRATPMTREDGAWVATLSLAPGHYPYKVVETDVSGGGDLWSCNPDEPLVQCDEGYTWAPECPVGASACNSLLEVPDCSVPRLMLLDARVDREAYTFSADVQVDGDATVTALLDGEPVGEVTDGVLRVPRTSLSEGRHVLEVSAVNAAGRASDPLRVPFWLDDRAWRSGLMYYVFVDRFADGDTSLNASEGTSSTSTDYVGGDWQGVIDRLDDLADMGVTVLWLTAPQDNAEGAFGASCNATYSGYHGYWPSSAAGLEEHFGDEATLRALIDGAHARGIRVLADWVGNHVHAQHPYATEHPDWFTPLAVCGDANNWNDIPETCWFDRFLPDVRYYDVDPLVTFVEDAVTFAKVWDLDGYRVDAVKHMPSSVFHNFAARARTELEGVEDFYTVGETFSGDRDLIMRYVGPDELDGQFDFPLYWALVAALARDEIGLSNGEGSLEDTWRDSQVAWGGALMSTFLGNHDVARFIAQASGEIGSLYGDSACGGDGNLRIPDTAPGWDEPYRRLMLGWTFLLTSEGLPLVYYGDEIGLPGYNDPDNRQMMRFDDALSSNEVMVRDHVATLGRARQEHPAFSSGTRTAWWEGESEVLAYARVSGDDGVLVAINRGDTSRTLTNGLGFAGLAEGTYRDVLTGDRFMSDGDRLNVDVPALGSRVLVKE